MSKAVIRNGRWSNEEGIPLDLVELHQLHPQLNRIHEFAKGVVELTHDKVEILSQILHVNPEQERAILKILSLTDDQINSLL